MKHIRFVLAIWFLGSLAVCLFACGSSDPESITVTPANPVLPLQATQQFVATGNFGPNVTPRDMTSEVTWSSSATLVATISESGFAMAVAAGTATITASFDSVAGSTTLTAISATLSSISISPANPSIPLQTTQQFAATGTFSDGTTHDLTSQVAWSSSATSVATVSSSGLAMAVAAGTTIITASWGSISGNTTLTVTSASLSSISGAPAILVGTVQRFIALGAFSDGTR